MVDPSRRLHLLVEGQTEEIVVRDVLSPYLMQRGFWVTYSLITTKRPAGGPNFKGGVISWQKLEREIRLLLGDTSLDTLSTMIDYYGFPEDGPGMRDRPTSGPYDRVKHVERELASRIDDRRFVPHLVLHELETWVFAAAEQLGTLHSDPTLIRQLQADIAAAGSPELVNDGPSTAPSKRLRGYCSEYNKTLDGPLAIAGLGFERIREQCPHLNDWLVKLGA